MDHTYRDPYSGKLYTFPEIDNSQRVKANIVKCTPAENDPNAHGRAAENRIVMYYDEQGQHFRWATSKEAKKEWKAPTTADESVYATSEIFKL